MSRLHRWLRVRYTAPRWAVVLLLVLYLRLAWWDVDWWRLAMLWVELALLALVLATWGWQRVARRWWRWRCPEHGKLCSGRACCCSDLHRWGWGA